MSSQGGKHRRKDPAGSRAQGDVVRPETAVADQLVNPAPAGEESLGRAGARGALWQGLATVLGKTVVLLTTVVMARILSPEEYGLVGLALVLIAYAETVADAGVAQALVYLPRSSATTRAAFACALLSGLFLVVLAFFCAPLIADMFDQPAVEPLVRVLAIGLVATAIGSTPEALLRANLRFKQQSIAMVVRAVATGVVSVGLVLSGAGVWSLAWGSVAGSVSFAVACWLLCGERVPFRLFAVTRREAGEVLRFGVPVASSNLLARLVFDIDYLIVGGVLGATALGFYTLAFRLPELLIINIFFVIASVTYPLYSKARHDPDRLRSGYLLSNQLQSLIGVCAGVGLAVTAPLVVPLVFGDKWNAAIAPLILLALYAASRSLGAGANEVYKAIGRPGLSVKLSALRLLILVPALFFGARWGIVGVAATQFVVALLFVVLMQGVAVRAIGITWRDLGRSMAPSFCCGVAVAAAALAARQIPLPPVLSLLVVIVLGAAAAATVMLVFYRDRVRQIRSVLQK